MTPRCHHTFEIYFVGAGAVLVIFLLQLSILLPSCLLGFTSEFWIYAGRLVLLFSRSSFVLYVSHNPSKYVYMSFLPSLTKM